VSGRAVTVRPVASELIEQGKISFTVESRVLRELGERLVKQPEVAVVELLKNAYDADATECSIDWLPKTLTISDNGQGMTLQRFTEGWMRIGTSSKLASRVSNKFGRTITGEKGIGRFAVRFLGRTLHLESVADDEKLKKRTKLSADFDWFTFDQLEDLGDLEVPYRLETTDSETPTGTKLMISRLRPEVTRLNLKQVRTSSLDVLTPLRSLFETAKPNTRRPTSQAGRDDGFTLKLSQGATEDAEPPDVAAAILDRFSLRATLRISKARLKLEVYKRDEPKPYLAVNERFPNEIGTVYADIRFFPRREGAFTGLPVDGRRAQSWISDNSGVAVFDRSFRVQPYGNPSDDWLNLQADAERNRRDPRSNIAKKHFPMSANVRGSTSENWMLRLPSSNQLVGLVMVEGRRDDIVAATEGLVASADREGFVENTAFTELQDTIRGAVEAMAYADRSIQREQEKARREASIKTLRRDTRAAIKEIERNPNIPERDKGSIVLAITQTQRRAEQQEETARAREQQLEVMSLLGVAAGFMSHEFGVALDELEATHKDLIALARRDARFRSTAEQFALHIKRLRDFVAYSSGYIQGARGTPSEPYPVRPRLLQVKRVFGKYAEDRNIRVNILAEPSLMAPLLPPSLYNGVALNLYTNALKAVTATIGKDGEIRFRAWDDARWHYLEVCDTGVGIPGALRERIFDPLFTTTQSQNDPLGSGMGLGLALVRQGVEAFRGHVDVVDPPPEFSTCIRVRFPL